MGIDLTNEQVYCIYKLENWWNNQEKQLFQISGAAGTGKTTIVKYFIERLGLKYENVLFMTFMGKAAMQLVRNGLPAKTIHSALYRYEEIVERDENGHMIFTDKGKVKLKHEFVLKEKIPKKIKLFVIDEASMINEKMGKDILSFNRPVITLGDLNQLPPVFGNPFFLQNPDVILHQIMRQKEGDPIIYLSQQVLHDEPLKLGVYGKSFVIPKQDISDFHFKKADIIITCTNRLRYNINNYCREYIKKIKNLNYPHINEKVICRKNNWGMSIENGIYLTNGMTGFVDYIYRDSYNKESMKMDFRPDFTTKTFKNITFDYKHMYAKPDDVEDNNRWWFDKFEYAYAITDFSSQGSQWPYVLYMFENFYNNKEDQKKHLYTAITRASDTIGIII